MAAPNSDAPQGPGGGPGAGPEVKPQQDTEARFASAMARLLPDPPPRQLGLSVSGGSDSTALLHLAANWAESRDIALFALTVDHGLREEAALEAEEVARQCIDLGVAHATLRWSGWGGLGNMQDAARRARRVLTNRWRGEVTDVLLGHTMDDQAETVLMRLSRGSGVEGLSAMAEATWALPGRGRDVEVGEALGTAPLQPATRTPGYRVLRPLLGLRRADLRAWLRQRGVMWADDPSNEDDRYERIQVRRLLRSGQGGLTIEGLAETATRMARARAALAQRAGAAAQTLAKVSAGDVWLDRDGLAALDADTRLRLVAGTLMWVASADYRPREAALIRLVDAALAGQGATLHGCQVIADGQTVLFCREYQAISQKTCQGVQGARWDKRWCVGAVQAPGQVVRALGEAGLAQLSEIPPNAPPPAARRSAPSLWDGEILVAAPTLGHGPQDWLILDPPRGEFTEAFMAH